MVFDGSLPGARRGRITGSTGGGRRRQIVSVLADTELVAGLVGLPEWRHQGNTIVRAFVLDGGFMGSVGFVNRLAEVAEAADHHPDIAINWNTVTVTIGSHRLGGVTPQCLELAAKVDLLAG